MGRLKWCWIGLNSWATKFFDLPEGFRHFRWPLNEFAKWLSTATVEADFMRQRFLILWVAFLLLSAGSVFAEGTNSMVNDLNDLVGKINAKITAGKTAAADFAEDIKGFDALLARHKGETNEELQMVLIMKAKLYLQVLNDPKEAVPVFQELKKEFPRTEIDVDGVIASLQNAIEKQKVQATLAVGAKFPDFEEKDLKGKPLSVSALKGKVVLIDFWATWCLPCRAELPNVIETYKKYHEKGFNIIGVSLDEDRAQLERFLPAAGMTWPQYFDGNGWENKLAQKYAVISVPTTYLLGRDGKIIARNLRGDELGRAVAKALDD